MRKPLPVHFFRHSPGRQYGLSLVELMISLTIGLVLLAGITSLIVRQSATRTELEKSSRQIENGRYAMQVLSEDIEHAGFYGEYSPLAAVVYNVPLDPCDTAIANLGWDSAAPAIPVAIHGYTGADTEPSCLANRKPGTAILVVRRTKTDTAATLDGTSAYLQVTRCNSDPSPFVLGMNAGDFLLKQKDCLTSMPVHKYVVHAYYISTCSNCGAGADSIPTLYMVENGGAPMPLVEGIENMQLDYGVDYLPLTGRDGAADCHFPNPSAITVAEKSACEAATGTAGDFTNSATNWSNVVTVSVNLLARNTEASTGYTDSKSYTLGSVSVPAANDKYKRHVYSQLVRVTNTSGRRE